MKTLIVFLLLILTVLCLIFGAYNVFTLIFVFWICSGDNFLGRR